MLLSPSPFSLHSRVSGFIQHLAAPQHLLGAALGNGIRLEGFDGDLTLGRTEWFGRSVPTLPIAFTLATGAAPDATYNLVLEARRCDRQICQRILPVAYGFHPTVNWTAGERVRTAYTLAAPATISGTTLSVQLVSTQLETVLDGLRGLALRVPKAARVGTRVDLGTVR